jgi:hypothetical protein
MPLRNFGISCTYKSTWRYNPENHIDKRKFQLTQEVVTKVLTLRRVTNQRGRDVWVCHIWER